MSYLNLKKDFPIFQKHKKLAYLDNAATTHKPKFVIKAIDDFYSKHNSNIHRGIYSLSQEATEMYESARITVAKFINSPSDKEIIFTKGATEAINLITATWGEQNIKKGDEIILSEMEHHANIVPWQQLAKKKKAKILYIPVLKNGTLDLKIYKKLISKKTKVIAITHVSNTLGTINPVKKIISIAKTQNITVLIDGCQAIQHFPVNVQNLNCDFYVFSGHKLYGPTGIGVLWSRYEILEKMPVYQTGGDMITSVTKEKTTFAKPPAKFEAGTPPIAQAIGLAAAIDYLEALDSKKIKQHEDKLLQKATRELLKIPDLKIYANIKEKAPIISFVIKNIHPHDLGTVLDQENVAVRTGQHCTQILMDKFSIPATTRASFSFYNTEKDVKQLVKGIKKAIKLLR